MRILHRNAVLHLEDFDLWVIGDIAAKDGTVSCKNWAGNGMNYMIESKYWKVIRGLCSLGFLTETVSGLTDDFGYRYSEFKLSDDGEKLVAMIILRNL